MSINMFTSNMDNVNYFRIINWFHKYMSSYSNEEGIKFYISKIEEELNETNEAISNNNLVEFLDGCIDLYWVIKGYEYFGGDAFSLQINPFEILFNNINMYSKELLQYELINDLIDVVADSNFTKELDGKDIIKGNSFINPSEGIKNIITKYNITLIS